MDKQHVKHRMLDLEQQRFDTSREAYLEYVSSARVDRSEEWRTDAERDAFRAAAEEAAAVYRRIADAAESDE